MLTRGTGTGLPYMSRLLLVRSWGRLSLPPRGRILFSGQCLGSDKNGRVAAVFCLGTWRFGGFSIGIGTKPAPKPGEQCLASDISPREECLGNGQNGQLMSGDIKIGALLPPHQVFGLQAKESSGRAFPSEQRHEPCAGGLAMHGTAGWRAPPRVAD